MNNMCCEMNGIVFVYYFPVLFAWNNFVAKLQLI
jgi:hypothetical protein